MVVIAFGAVAAAMLQSQVRRAKSKVADIASKASRTKQEGDQQKPATPHKDSPQRASVVHRKLKKLHNRGGRYLAARAFVVRGTITMLLLLYVPVLLACFGTLVCVSNPEDESELVLFVDATVSCSNDSNHLAIQALAAAVAIVLIWVLPVLVARKLRLLRNEGELRRADMLQHLGPM